MTHFSGERIIVPYRNIVCIRENCVYDIEELIYRFK
jgi:hypothetical protein